jgi:adenylyl cyclase-associated protein
MPKPKILITVPSCWETDARLTMVTRRLEAATSRLEDMATSVDASHPDIVAAINSASATPAESAAAAIIEPPPQPADPLPRSIEDFDKIIKEDVQAFATASEKIGGLVEEQVQTLRNFIRGEADTSDTG